MLIQAPSAAALPSGKVLFQWTALATGAGWHATSIQIASDSEFTTNCRTFVIPPTVFTCELDTGKGGWYYRIGAWLGTPQKGAVEWTGIYGPIHAESAKGIVPIAPMTVHFQSVQPALDAILFHSGVYEPYYLIFDYTFQGEVKASTAKTVYIHDWGKAEMPVENLEPARTYTFRVATFQGKRGTLPAAEIKQLTEWTYIRNKRAAAPVRARNFTEGAVYEADKVLLREAREKKSLRFSSYADYMQHLAARARTTERRDYG
jgi:hypothetical protein